MNNEDGFTTYISAGLSVFATIFVTGIIVFYLQFNPFVPMVERYGTNTTDTITVSDKIYDANNNWYEIITTDNVKYLTEPQNLSEQFEVNYTYSVVIEKKQLKLNLLGGSWSNTTYITSLSKVGVKHEST